MDIEKYIGRLLDNRYEILEVIGTGGMAVVYKARCHRLNRLVAIKILKDDLSQDEEFRRRFHAESQAVAMLSHPNIMSVYDVSTTDTADYIVMELIDGITLKQYMEKKGTLNWKETLHFAMQIGKALEHAHSRGIVHRDIKPHNVMVLKNGSVKVTDFGIARIMSKSNTLTKEALGSVHYISPEQAKGGRVDNRSDIYSLGVVMYEMMTGRAPYDGESPVAVAIQHINGGAAMPSVLNPNIPGGLEQIIMKAMSVDPAKRYNTATALLYDLEEFRKNPSILFDFNDTPVDDATMRIQPVAAPVPQQPRNAAERVAGVRTDRPVQQRQSPAQNRPVQQRQPQPSRPGQPEPQIRQEQPRSASAGTRPSREAREEVRESRNHTVTVAVVTCSAIAVIAIVIFLVVLLNGGLLGNNSTMVQVPDLLGQIYDDFDHTKYPDVTISVSDYENSDEYEFGQICDQKPEAGTQVPLGSEVKIWVSMGPEQEALPTMSNLTEWTEDGARNYLIALDGDFDIRVEQEHSEDVEEGLITRTEPAEGVQLEQGQTVILYLSMGPEAKLVEIPKIVFDQDKDGAMAMLLQYGFEKVDSQDEESTEPENTVLRLTDAQGKEIKAGDKIDVTTEIIVYYSSGELIEKMPNVIGITVESARDTLEKLKFSNVETQEEYNESVEAGKVIRANIPEGTRIDVTTAIILTVSMGPEPTETTAPPETTEPEITKTVTIVLPQDRTEPYQLTVMYQGDTLVDQTIQPGTGNYVFQVSGRGTGYIEIHIDGEYVRTEKVDFSA